jgi:hypothetical protein
MLAIYASLAKSAGKLGLKLVARRPQSLLGLVKDLDINADRAPEKFAQRLEAALGPIELAD